MTRAKSALLATCILAVLPASWISYNAPVAVYTVSQEDDCPAVSALGFELDSVVRVSPTRVACEYGRGWF